MADSFPDSQVSSEQHAARPGDAILGEAALLARVDGDRELLREIVALFREDCPRLLAQIGAAIAAGDAALVKRAAHTLKGAVVNFGSDSAAHAALALETMGRSADLTGAAGAFTELEKAVGELNRALERLA